MNRNKLKTYAPQARRDFIQAVTDRATQYGLTAKKIEPMTEQGEVVLIAGQPFPKAVGVKRKKLEARIQKLGFEQTMEAMAYTWFNRLVAIRFMELHGYLEHGFQVLSHPEGHTQPEILEHAQHVDLPGLNQKKVVELKLDGTKEEELYRLLLIAQCNALHKALPFLFETINDEAELLLPDHLLHSDSLIRNMVNEIDEEDWQEVEIIGWLYESYISEKKDEVIGKVVASEDIPAATQLFTPNWIVKYLVQNTLGRQWMTTYPNSPLKGQMAYYIEPAEQTPEVQEQLKAITPTSLNPEELTFLDPACGSGHILVEAYDLFKAIYEERGYRAKDIPAFILKRNLFGLEIDDRAAQLAAFALIMKARADDRRIFETDAKPNILSFEDSKDMKADEIYHALMSPLKGEQTTEPEAAVPEGYLFEPDDNLFTRAEAAKAKATANRQLPTANFNQADIASLLELFENAKTFGSLIQVPPKLAAKLSWIEQRLNDVLEHGDLTHAPAHVLKPFLHQARLLARQYDVVVANPPYMGNKYMNNAVKDFTIFHFSECKADVFAAFMDRSAQLCTFTGQLGFVTPYVWMFISSYADFRKSLLSRHAITSLIQLEYNAFEPACVPVCTLTLLNSPQPCLRGDFIRLSDFKGHQNQSPRTLEAIRNPLCGWRFQASSSDFEKISGSPLAYWVSQATREVFANSAPLGSVSRPMKGMFTGNDAQYVRFHWEVADLIVDCDSHAESARRKEKWYPYLKGGDYRKWYGNILNVVDFQNDGMSLKASGKHGDRNPQYYFRQCLTWSDITTSNFVVRFADQGGLPSSVGNFIVGDPELLFVLSGLLCSKIATEALKILNPTFHANPGDVALIPYVTEAVQKIKGRVAAVAERAIHLARMDWDSTETSLGFSGSELMSQPNRLATLSESHTMYAEMLSQRRGTMRQLEEENNRLFIEAYGLHDELSPEVPDEQITLSRPDREEDIKRLLSYAIGCMMGRYSLDKPGMVYPYSDNRGFDANQYKTFPADEDGIIPITEFKWFSDDSASRFEKFIATAWPADHLEENLRFVSECLGMKKGDSSQETIRRYFAVDFFKNHLLMYKKRPIYWLFSSGRQRGFQALVYLHRYNEATLARMRTEYVVPLLGKMTARIDHLTDDISAASSSQHRKRLETEKATTLKQRAEVQTFEEKLRHSADQRIKLNLDDGVKVNYGKFGNLLAEVKSVTGANSDG